MPETLSVLKVGHDAPWVTSWTGEAHLVIGRCSSVMGRLALCQADAPGSGKLQYSCEATLASRPFPRGRYQGCIPPPLKWRSLRRGEAGQ